jgi:acyl carrier protein
MTSRLPERDQIGVLVLQAIRQLNEWREWFDQIPASAEALLDVRGGPLDSLDLMTLLLEVEERLHAAGVDIDLADVQTLSQKPYPLHSVATLVDYVWRQERTIIR